MKSAFVRFGVVSLFALVVAGCGGGDGSNAVVAPPPATGSVKDAIAAAATNPANDTSTNSASSFSVLQAAGLPVVVVNDPSCPPTEAGKTQTCVNFTVFSDRSVVTGLTGALSSATAVGVTGVAIAKLIPGTNGNFDQWQNYTHRTRGPATGTSPSAAVQATIDNPAYPSVTNGHTDGGTVAIPASRLVYNADGYYTYKFATDITNPDQTKGSLDGSSVIFEPGLTHRVAVQVAYTNAAGERVVANPYFDFTLNANGTAYASVPVTDPAKTRKMVDVASCNGCHENLTLHSGGRNDVQYCVMCHNPRSVDANSGNPLTLATMIHSLHAGRLLHSKGVNYTVRSHEYTEVGFPQDLRNCTKCHSGANPATPQGDNWKTRPSKEACLSCHASTVGSDWETRHKVFAEDPLFVGPGAQARDLTNAQCANCHRPGSAIAPERVHWNQNEENAARYKMNIESVAYDGAARLVTVKYFLSDPTNGNAAYNLVTADCTGAADRPCGANTRFGNLQLRVAYQNLVGQTTGVTEFTAYNNGGNNVFAWAHLGTNDGNDHYTVGIPIPADTATAVAAGTARVVSIGQIKEPLLQVKSATDPRPEVVPTTLINTVVQQAYQDFAISGPLNPRRTIVATEKCNVCHGALGTTSGSNTLANAFHGGARNIVQACVVCHDANRANSSATSSVMTNGLGMYESFHFKRMIHGIHGNSKRTYPFVHGNRVQATFDDKGIQLTDGIRLSDATPVPAGTPVTDALNGGATATNFAAEVAWPGVGINCNVCHVDNSYKVDRGPIGSVVNRNGATDPLQWLVITPKASTCTACHDSAKAIGHVASFGGAGFGNLTQAQGSNTQEICADCHSSGGIKGVDIVHGQK